MERLEVYAWALAQAQAQYATAGEGSDELPELSTIHIDNSVPWDGSIMNRAAT